MSESAPIAPTPTTPAGRRRVARADRLLALLTVGFAFLASSFTARNSDLWLHLATGRLLAQGGYTFGVDPFAYTTTGVYWANHSWLFDLGLYQAYAWLSGTGLVVLKAAGVALLAGVLLRASQSRGPFWVAAACTLLAVLAMSPRLLLQPTCLSFLLLAVCVERLRTGGRATWVVPPLIALWVNVDGWFLLGPVVVALFWSGRRIAPDPANHPVQPPWLMPASVLACLLSPHHVHALALPPELSPAVWRSALQDDPRLADLFLPSWRLVQSSRVEGLDLATWASAALLAIGLLSFAANRRAVPGWRGLTFALFAVLAAWQVRLIPFFAVVAGPIVALNLQDVLSPRFLVRTGRWFTFGGALALTALAWPGWLQGLHTRGRAVSWAVQPDPSLERAAGELARWRKNGALPAGSHTFETHPDAAHAVAWFCPGEKVFLDSRLQLFTHVAADYRRLNQVFAILPDGVDERAGTGDEVLQKYGIAAGVTYDPDARRIAAGLRRTAQAVNRLELLRVSGAAVIVAPRRDPTCRPAVPSFDADRSAFGCLGDSDPPPAPEEGPLRLPEPVPWWEFFARKPDVRSWEAGAANAYLRLFEDAAVRSASAPGAKGAARSPALPLLAIRAARGAVAANPADAAAWVELGRAYLFLSRGTWEADPSSVLPLLGPLRHVQTAAALYQAVTLDPDSLPAHDLLAGLFTERQYLDLALRHRQAQLRLTRGGGPLPGEAPDAFAARVASLTATIEQLEAAAQDSENRFLVRTHAAAGDPLARAKVALQLGLVARAQDVLLHAHPDLYGPEGVALLLRVLVQTGQVEQARVLLDREELVHNPASLGFYDLAGGQRNGHPWGYRFSAYSWYDLCQAAGSGRYERAFAALGRLRDQLEQDRQRVGPQVVKAFARQVVSEIGLAAPPAPPCSRLHVERECNRLAGYLSVTAFLPVQQADFDTIGGLLLAEQGRPVEAGQQFQRALDRYARAEPTAPVLPGRGVALRYQNAIRRHPQ